MSASGRSRRAWGWHPLTDSWARRIVDSAGVRAGELVLDIGAGDGALTRPLVRAGARVIAVEFNPARAAALRHTFRDDPVTVVQADAADLRLPRRPFRVVSSPPYGITSALLGRLLSAGSRMREAHLVLQRAAAYRFAEGRGPGARQRQWTVDIGSRLPRSAFRPPPRVDSVVLVIRRVR